MTRTAAFVMLLVAGCATAGDERDDAEAETGTAQPLGRDDVDELAGLYRWADADRPYWANDVPSLALTETAYIRSRCYGWDCAKLVPQLGDVEWYESSSHKLYIRFMSFVKVPDGEEWIEEPRVGDAYEVATTDDGIKLRKTYTSRWMYLDAVTPESACEASGGTWADDACACPELPDADWSHYIDFFPGLGGCFEIHATTEDGCAETHGSYLDDDRSAIGTYCLCPVGTYETNAGCESIY